MVEGRQELFSEQTFGEIMDLSAELSENMANAFLLQVSDLSRTHEIHLVYGDLLKIILALRDYAEIMDQVCDEWSLEGIHRVIYELRARNLRGISEKLETGIGFHYDAAMEKCQRRKLRRIKDRGVGESKSVFPTDESLLKMLYLAMMDITRKWTGRRQDWSRIHAQMAVYFEDRMPE